MNPKYPVIWLGDKCGLMHFQDQDAFFTTDLMFWGALTFDWGSVVCSDSIEWSISVSKKEKVSLGKRLKALAGHLVHTRVEYDYSKIDELSLEDLKSRLIRQSENDPGDVMWQFVEHEDIVKGVMTARSVDELFDFLRDSVCGEGEA
ncbi:MAG: hypothetical protein OER91_06795 [Gammaproteobacteria bacterium]|nr:hypothetical protein [Gammaproteobacteria bacterium]